MMSLCHCHSVGIAMATGWARAPTQPHIHPAPYTHLQELSVAVVTEAARASGRREGLNVCVRETSSSLVGTTMSRCLASTSTACIHLRFMRKREKRSRERTSWLTLTNSGCCISHLVNDKEAQHQSAAPQEFIYFWDISYLTPPRSTTIFSFLCYEKVAQNIWLDHYLQRQNLFSFNARVSCFTKYVKPRDEK